MKKKYRNKDKNLVIHPGTQAIIEDGLYHNAAKLQKVINKFLKKAKSAEKDKKTKTKLKDNVIPKKTRRAKKINPDLKPKSIKKSKK